METIGHIGDIEAGTLLGIVRSVVNRMLSLFGSEKGWEGRTGGYFCLAEEASGMPMLLAQIGIVFRGNAERYLLNAQEKVRRLVSHPDHVGSMQSRNPDKWQWGGAVRVGGLIFSFSGLPEVGDEAAMLLAAYYFFIHGGRGTDLASSVAERLGNTFYTRYRNA